MADRDKVTLELERRTEQFITDGLQEWSAAGNLALQSVQNPQDEGDSIIYWLVSLAGNMMWAGTIFLRPALNGLPSVPQKTLSVIGAGFGSDTARQVKNLLASPPEPDHAKEFFAEMIALRADQMEDGLIKETAEWVQTDFIDELSRWMKNKWWNQNPAPKAAASENWILDQIANMNAIEENASRYYAYQNFIFPGLVGDTKDFKVGTMRQKLKAEMMTQATHALTSYKASYDQWRAKIRRQTAIDDHIRPAPGTPSLPPVEVRVPFEPNINFGNTFLWTPAGNQTAGQVVRKWRYRADA
jgi:hypothetical protein